MLDEDSRARGSVPPEGGQTLRRQRIPRPLPQQAVTRKLGRARVVDTLHDRDAGVADAALGFPETARAEGLRRGGA